MTPAPIAVVTGASRGIGRAIARSLASTHELILVGRDSNRLSLATKELESIPRETQHPIHSYALNLSDPSEIRSFLKDIKGVQVSSLIHSAGISHNGLLARTSQEDIESVLHTNLTSSLLLSQGLLKGMMVKRSGNIIFISSIVGLNGNAGQTVYSASKAALFGLTKSLAKEVGSRGIRVNCVAPGFICTDMTRDLPAGQKQEYLSKIPLGRFGDPKDVAQAVQFLLEAPYITGQTLVIDGGMT